MSDTPQHIWIKLFFIQKRAALLRLTFCAACPTIAALVATHGDVNITIATCIALTVSLYATTRF